MRQLRDRICVLVRQPCRAQMAGDALLRLALVLQRLDVLVLVLRRVLVLHLAAAVGSLLWVGRSLTLGLVVGLLSMGSAEIVVAEGGGLLVGGDAAERGVLKTVGIL